MISNLRKRISFKRDHKWTDAHVNDYVDDDMSEDQHKRVEKHTGICPDCRYLLDSLLKTAEELVKLRTKTPSDLKPKILERLRRDD